MSRAAVHHQRLIISTTIERLDHMHVGRLLHRAVFAFRPYKTRLVALHTPNRNTTATAFSAVKISIVAVLRLYRGNMGKRVFFVRRCFSVGRKGGENLLAVCWA
jgi:hypothetical protein